MTTAWLILADDLTGAADCAVAFARQGHAASVTWGEHARAGEAVLAVDADSRRLSPDAAAARHVRLLKECSGGETRLFKKIDSTLRGQPAAELAATLSALNGAGQPALALVAPAFPANGRTTIDGRVMLDGRPLEATPLWQRDHGYPTADLMAVLASQGLRSALLPLATLRAGGEAALGAAVQAALTAGHDALVCDAASSTDLDIIARASLALPGRFLWVGSGGLAASLAACGPDGRATAPATRPAGPAGLLMVVGSVAEASRAAAERVMAQGGVRRFGISPALLRAGPTAWAHTARTIAASLADHDALVIIEAEDRPDLRHGAPLAQALASLLRPAGLVAGGIFATGGETACALLSQLGIHGIRMLDEVEAGVPLGISQGVLTMPVVTKAGGFGNAGSIGQARRRLRALQGKETP